MKQAAPLDERTDPIRLICAGCGFVVTARTQQAATDHMVEHIKYSDLQKTA